MDEIWKDIPDYPIYQVSNFGQVRSCDRYVPGKMGSTRFQAGKVLKAYKFKDRYLHVKLFRGSKHDNVTWLVHRLVMLAFISPCPSGMEVHHLNHDETDNRLENLRYVTHQQNSDYSIHRRQRGEEIHASKLTEDDVREIRRIYPEGNETHRSLAKKYSVSHVVIRYVIHRKTWKHID